MLRKITHHATQNFQRVGNSKIIGEFQEFAMRGSVVDLAIGIMVGGAFNKIVTSLVNDIIMPPLSLLMGRMDFTNLFIDLSSREFITLTEAKAAGVPTINYGLFLSSILDFTIIAFVTFLLVKQINRWRRKAEDPVPQPMRTCPRCISMIHQDATKCPQCTAELAPE